MHSGQPRDRPGIEVVVVIVGDHDDVDPRQILEGEPRGAEPARARPRQRAGARAPVGVGQDRQPVELDDEGGVPDPRDGRRGRAAAERATVIGDARSTERPRRRQALPGARGEEAPPRPAIGPMKPWVRVPESAQDMMGRLPRKRLRSDAGTACGAQEQAEEDRGSAHARSVPGPAQTDQTRALLEPQQEARAPQDDQKAQMRGGARRPHARRSRARGVRGHVWAPQTKVRQSDNVTRYVARRPRAPTKQMGLFQPPGQDAQKGPDARRRPTAAREA
jgi:hypothetical protein